MKSVLTALFFCVFVYTPSFSQNLYEDSTLIYISISTEKIMKNKKEKNYNSLYVFDINQNWIYFGRKNPKYSLTIKDISLDNGSYFITAEKNTKRKGEIKFVVPTNSKESFLVQENGTEYVAMEYEIHKKYFGDLMK